MPERLRRLDDNALADSVMVQYTVLYPPIGVLLGSVSIVAGLILWVWNAHWLFLAAVGGASFLLALLFAPRGTTGRMLRHPVAEWVVLVKRLRTEGRLNR